MRPAGRALALTEKAGGGRVFGVAWTNYGEDKWWLRRTPNWWHEELVGGGGAPFGKVRLTKKGRLMSLAVRSLAPKH